MKRIALLFSLLVVACASPSYPGVDQPNSMGNTTEDQAIIDYIDQRLESEYYWLDEVASKCNSFDRRVKWDTYLGSVLSRLTSNTDDGYVMSNGKRVYYSYIRELSSTTRSQVLGLGIDLHTTIVIIDSENKNYGFIVENVYKGSPAEQGGVRRGDIIVRVNDSPINANNYMTLFNSIYQNSMSKVKLQLRRQVVAKGESSTYSMELEAGSYEESTVAHSEIIRGIKPVGYLVYTGFESAYDDALLAALREFADEGVKEIILDLRTNTGGALTSAIKLTSTLLPASFEGAVLCEVKRNPKNIRSAVSEVFALQPMEFNLDIDHLTVITSGSSASASELVIMGLRGLDVPVTLVGDTTQGKNCGMDVTVREIGSVVVEYAPITFMCFNAKGVGDWGEGIAADVNVKEIDEYYPLPRVPWGSDYVMEDVALRTALECVGYRFEDGTRSGAQSNGFERAATVEEPAAGIRLYE